MDETYKNNGCRITLDINGSDVYEKISYPLRHGIYTEIETKDAILQFDRSGQIIYAKGKGREWLHPQEWLKRSVGNDWVYYSTGGYSGVYEAIGEFYLPNLQYPTNSLIGGTPFKEKVVEDLLENWYQIFTDSICSLRSGPEPVCRFLDVALINTPERLKQKAEALFEVTGGRVTVLPPDARHVDYNIIPLMVAEGCLYKCRFCKVKSANSFSEKPREEISSQLRKIRELYGVNLANYNSVFLGEHDVLQASPNGILHAIEKAIQELCFSSSYMRGGNFFLFGSVDSLLSAPENLFIELSKIPFSFYINIGLESADQETLDLLGKPITTQKVTEAFARSQDINDKYLNIEITSNFVMDAELPDGHYPAFLNLVRDNIARLKPKGCIYMSPLKFGQPKRELLFTFNRFKVLSRLPTFLYIIQRL